MPPHHLLPLLLLLLQVPPLLSHQSISYPYPTTRQIACRIGGGQYCPGPCPNTDKRLDITPHNPSITVKRGSLLRLNILANNHRGGFHRWSLVHVRHMFQKNIHRKSAFLYTCADLNVSQCSRRNRKRDCRFDRSNQYMWSMIRIPKIYADGVYVLGWVWYGGGKGGGDFGDYYDCLYIRVRGGPYRKTHRAEFRMGNSATGRNGRCRATVNRIGVCYKEPCPGGGRRTTMQRPWEFEGGRSGGVLKSTWFAKPWREERQGVRVRALKVVHADYPGRVFANSNGGRRAHVFFGGGVKITVVCETGGGVREVRFFINGKKARVDYEAPYSIAGDWRDGGGRGKVVFAPWKFKYANAVTTISCQAVGRDGSQHWGNLELSTDF